mmetsp:Transcript_28381/g.25067  ORF Transcript_28381/g.25067 Transcript_28381/m.25067 type:complete len:116 (+) Transcript_28381:99-446(+)
MNHQSRPSRVENVILSALDPRSTTVYYMANGGIIILMITLLVLYFIVQSYHFLIMELLALGLLLSVNFVWMNRVDPDQQDKEDAKSKAKPSGLIGNDTSTGAPTTPRRRKKKRKE